MTTDYNDLNHDHLNHTIGVRPDRKGPAVALRPLVLTTPAEARETAEAGFDRMPLGTGSAPIPVYFYIDPNFYDARAIIRDLVLDNKGFLSDEPLPDPVEFPPALKAAVDRGDLTPANLHFVLDYLSGHDKALLVQKNGGESQCERVMLALATFDQPMYAAGAKQVAHIIKRMRAEYELAPPPPPLVVPPLASATPTAQPARIGFPTRIAPPTAVVLEPDDAILVPSHMPTAESPIGPITRIPDHVFSRLVARQQSVVRGVDRVSWPFKNMAVGEEVMIASELAKRGQVAAYMFARRTKRAFSTMRDRATGTLRVRRLPDPKGR